MVIHFIIGTLGGGGAERVMTLIANHFVQDNHEVSIITMNPSSDTFELDKRIKRINVARGNFPVVRIKNLLNLKGFYRSPSNRPDVAISFLTASNITAILACRYHGIPIIASEHNNHLAVANPKWLTKLCWKYVYPRADALTVLTSFDVDYFRKKGANVKVMPNPVSFEVYEKDIQIREKNILAVGNLDRYHHKGFDNLIPLAASALVKHKDWKLTILGEGKNGRNYLNNLIEKTGLQAQILLPGFSKEVSKIMRQSSIFVLPSRFEGLPMVLLEAMSQGMSCIAYDCITGPGDIISNYSNGILIEDQNKASMALGLEELIENENLRIQLGKEARTSIQNYKIEVIYAKWLELIESIR